MPYTFSTDEIHFPSDLFKVIQGVGVGCKRVIGVILKTKVGKVDHSHVGCPTDPLFHGFRIVTEPAAKFA